MKQIFDNLSQDMSKMTTRRYSTSFSLGIRFLNKDLHKPIYSIYGFVRFADEIVDSFHEYPKEELLNRFEEDLFFSLENKISLNPILNSFQKTVDEFSIDHNLIVSFLKSMRWDLEKKVYNTVQEYKDYIYGSADVVGLMCLKVFVKGDELKYKELKPTAMALGSAFQKVNFLRDLKNDFQELDRTYFPNVDFKKFDEDSKQLIINEIQKDFDYALTGIFKLPNEARFGVYTAYKYYSKLLLKLKRTSSINIQNTRIRVPNYQKITVFARSYLKYRLNLL